MNVTSEDQVPQNTYAMAPANSAEKPQNHTHRLFMSHALYCVSIEEFGNLKLAGLHIVNEEFGESLGARRDRMRCIL